MQPSGARPGARHKLQPGLARKQGEHAWRVRLLGPSLPPMPVAWPLQCMSPEAYWPWPSSREIECKEAQYGTLHACKGLDRSTKVIHGHGYGAVQWCGGNFGGTCTCIFRRACIAYMPLCRHARGGLPQHPHVTAVLTQVALLMASSNQLQTPHVRHPLSRCMLALQRPKGGLPAPLWNCKPCTTHVRATEPGGVGREGR